MFSNNKNNIFEIKIFLFIENLSRILYSREVCSAQGRADGGQGALRTQFPMVHHTLSRESSV